jgi:hypothetical protein
MRYTVASERQAQQQLARLWTRSTSSVRRAITRASAAIDAQLRDDPVTKAKARPEGLFIIDEPPLRAYFEVSEPDRLVTITDYVLIA